MGIILGLSFLGEILAWLIPLPIPPAIYGMVLLFLGLMTGIIPKRRVRETGNFLVSILPLLFVAPAVGLISYWDVIFPHLLPILLIIVLSTVVTFTVAGIVTQLLTKKQKGGKKDA